MSNRTKTEIVINFDNNSPGRFQIQVTTGDGADLSHRFAYQLPINAVLRLPNGDTFTAGALDEALSRLPG